MATNRSEYLKQWYQNRKTDPEWLSNRREKQRLRWMKIKETNPALYQEKLKRDVERITAAREAAKVVKREVD